jgi:hypothetical protein
MGQGTETQKRVTDQYKQNWEQIFNSVKTRPIEQEQLELPLTEHRE